MIGVPGAGPPQWLVVMGGPGAGPPQQLLVMGGPGAGPSQRLVVLSVVFRSRAFSSVLL